MQHNIIHEDGIFYLFDCYFKLLTKNISPLEMNKDENVSAIHSFEIWAFLWKNKEEEHVKYLDMINES